MFLVFLQESVFSSLIFSSLFFFLFRVSTGNFEERTPPGTVQLLTPSTQPEPPQPADLAEQSRSETSMAIDSNGTEPEIAQAEIDAMVSEEVQKDDPVKSFLPPVMTKCPEELQVFHFL